MLTSLGALIQFATVVIKMTRSRVGRTAWVHIPAVSFISCVTDSGQVLNLSELQLTLF